MKPGRELDALIAKCIYKVGPRKLKTFNDEPHWPLTWPELERGFGYFELPKFSTDIAAAWEVALAMIANGFECVAGTGLTVVWDVTFRRHDVNVHAGGDTVPHAICLAALKAVGYTK